MTRHRLAATLTAAAVLLATACQPVGPASAPQDVDAQLARLIVAEDQSMDGYSRDKFPHWITISGTCDTRETVLKRDGRDVVTGIGCSIQSGTWASPYDDGVWTNHRDVDIDHVVPLAEAWRSGANSWTASKRREFANDLTRPQLIAVTDNVNQAKGDKDPARWKPSRPETHCGYARDWVEVKHHYGLTVDPPEKTALAAMLRACGVKKW